MSCFNFAKPNWHNFKHWHHNLYFHHPTHSMKYLTYTVAGYMLLALIWWAVLLTQNNKALFKAESEAMQLKYNTLYGVENFTLDNVPEYHQLVKKHQRKKYMILGEGLVFGIMLISGIWFIQKSLERELDIARKQKNFLLSITHELKSPIASINLILQTLIKRSIPPDKSREMHENALSESTRLENLINNLLFTTKINTEYQYNFEATDISTLASSLVKKYITQHPELNVEHKIEDGITGFVDREAFVSVVMNLMENADKYGEPPKKIQISLQKTDPDTVVLKVTDNGPGIPAKEKSRIFEQFYRSGSEETRKTKGTGLGLYIVKKIVQAHRGKIRVLDHSPKGSIFEVSLPIRPI